MPSQLTGHSLTSCDRVQDGVKGDPGAVRFACSIPSFTRVQTHRTAKMDERWPVSQKRINCPFARKDRERVWVSQVPLAFAMALLTITLFLGTWCRDTDFVLKDLLIFFFFFYFFVKDMPPSPSLEDDLHRTVGSTRWSEQLVSILQLHLASHWFTLIQVNIDYTGGIDSTHTWQSHKITKSQTCKMILRSDRKKIFHSYTISSFPLQFVCSSGLFLFLFLSCSLFVQSLTMHTEKHTRHTCSTQAEGKDNSLTLHLRLIDWSEEAKMQLLLEQFYSARQKKREHRSSDAYSPFHRSRGPRGT